MDGEERKGDFGSVTKVSFSNKNWSPVSGQRQHPEGLRAAFPSRPVGLPLVVPVDTPRASRADSGFHLGACSDCIIILYLGLLW